MQRQATFKQEQNEVRQIGWFLSRPSETNGLKNDQERETVEEEDCKDK